MKASLKERQSQMKRRLQHGKTENATENRLHTVGWGRPRLAQRGRQSRRPARIIERPKDFRSVRAEADSGSEKHRECLLKRKDFISAKTVIDDQFISNIPTGHTKPSRGEPWTYYLFALLITKHQGKHGVHEIHTKYVEILSGPTEEAVTDKLEELITRPGVECSALEKTR